ncbi:uvrABC system protein B [Ditylenchus destructor]|uniref:UvrABC system protein B n=1 Tax=Ditylenchus destructor TaxID=166010 RepID=A0AAD4MJE1_9BILA|nr:uvrABC system protein B [Ditylenchus destructor]
MLSGCLEFYRRERHLSGTAMPENNEAIADLKKLDPIGPAKQGEFVKFPGSPFELYQPYPPAGDQPAAIEGWWRA